MKRTLQFGLMLSLFACFGPNEPDKVRETLDQPEVEIVTEKDNLKVVEKDTIEAPAVEVDSIDNQ